MISRPPWPPWPDLPSLSTPASMRGESTPVVSRLSSVKIEVAGNTEIFARNWAIWDNILIDSSFNWIVSSQLSACVKLSPNCLSLQTSLTGVSSTGGGPGQSQSHRSRDRTRQSAVQRLVERKLAQREKEKEKERECWASQYTNTQARSENFYRLRGVQCVTSAFYFYITNTFLWSHWNHQTAERETGLAPDLRTASS